MKRILTLIVCTVSLNAVGQVPNYLPYNPDFDGDSWIGINDLLNVLSVYAAEWENGELLVSSDSTAAMLYVGEKEIHWCYHDCVNLNGPWEVAQKKDFMRHMPMLEEFYGKPMIQPFENRLQRDVVWIGTGGTGLSVYSLQGYYSEDGSEISLDIANSNIYIDGTYYTQSEAGNMLVDCWCATKERPKVEYSVVEASSGSWNGILNGMAEEGWLLLPQGPFGSQITFWRWAD